jgi:hypothetical protein
MAECDLLPEGVQKDAASPSSLAGCSALRQTTYTYLPARVLGKFRSAKSREQNWTLGKLDGGVDGGVRTRLLKIEGSRPWEAPS